MSDFSIRKAMNKTPVSDPAIREKYGLLGAVVGIAINLLLFILKLVTGLTINSISVMADAFNNLSDMASSVITLIGFKLSSRPADKGHPFGHGRIEYFSGLVVSVLVLYVGIQFLVTSVRRLLDPSPLEFQWVPVILFLVSILLKIWIASFNSSLGDKIQSSALKASALDARSDVFISATVVTGLFVSHFTGWQIDGFVGLFVAIMIIRSAFELIRETLDPLLGIQPDDDVIDRMEEILISHREIFDVHDTIVHNYGPNTTLATTHVDIREDISVTEIHDIIDALEKRVKTELNIDLVVHMDPNRTSDDRKIALIKDLRSELLAIPGIRDLHDIRLRDDSSRFIAEIVLDPASEWDSVLASADTVIEDKGLVPELTLELDQIVVHNGHL